MQRCESNYYGRITYVMIEEMPQKPSKPPVNFKLIKKVTGENKSIDLAILPTIVNNC